MKTHLQHRQLSCIAGLVAAFILNEAKAVNIFPIATNSESEFAFGTAFDGSNYLVAIQVGSFTNGSITAQRVSQSGTNVGSRILTGDSGFMPLLAFDGTNYLMVWSGSATNPGFRGRFVSKSGTLGNSVTIDTVTPRAASIAYGGGKYLTCWSGGGTLMGRLVTPAGTNFAPSFPISGTVDQTRNSAVAFDGNNFFVAFNGSGNLLTNIYGRFVSTNGDLVVVPDNRLIDGSTDPSDNPLAATFDGTNYLVAFNDEVGGLGGAFHVFGRLVTTSGIVLTNRIPLANGPGAQHFPALAFDGSSHLLAWMDGVTMTNLNLIFRFFNRAGEPLGPEFSPFMSQGTNLAALGGPFFGGTKYLLVGMLGNFSNGLNATNADVYGAFIPGPPRLDVAGPLAGAHFPLLLTGTTGFSYVIQMTTNVALPNWTALVTNSPTNGTFSFTDSQATNASRFYRAMTQ